MNRHSAHEKLILDQIRSAASECAWRCFWYDQVSSTMDIAREQASQVQPDLSIAVFSERQSSGRGRQGRVWRSPEGGLYCTLVTHYSAQLQGLTGLSLAVGCAIRRAVRELGVDTALKWPNDLLVGDKKLAGILIETVEVADGVAVLTGIGLNREGSESELSDVNGTSLSALGASASNREQCAVLLLRNFEQVWQQFKQSGFSAFQAEWEQANALRGRRIEVENGSTIQRGVVRGVSNQGALLIENAGEILTVISGHIVKIGDS